jgi:hypothetical protein
MELYASTEQRAKVLALEQEQLGALQASLSQQLVDRLPPGDTEAQFAHTFPNGITVVVSRKVQERWVPIDGQSDEFWTWVFSNNLAPQFTTRALKQDGVDQWRRTHQTPDAPDGALPPYIKRMSIVKPHVGVKGLTPPKTPNK